jgi:peptidoglycan/xylan/chitin deacetylase (PgdA/CDA1 family)
MKTAYLTIDDGPSQDFGNKVQFLLSRNAAAIFFCLGCLLEERQADVVHAIRNGFLIGNHSYSHPKFSEIAICEAKREITRTHQIIERLYKRANVRRPINVFRFPHGDKGNEETRDVFQTILRNLGYKQPKFARIHWYGKSTLGRDLDTYWTFNTKDYTVERYRRVGRKSPYGVSSKKAILRRMDEDDPRNGKGLNVTNTNDIVLAHDGEMIADVFVAIVNKLSEKGLTMRLPQFE